MGTGDAGRSGIEIFRPRHRKSRPVRVRTPWQVCAMRLAACCSPRQYSVVCSGRSRSSWTGAPSGARWGSRPSLHEGLPRKSPHGLKPRPALQSTQSVPTFEYLPSGDPPPGREWHADGQVRCSEAAVHQRQLMAVLSPSCDSRHRRQSNVFRTLTWKVRNGRGDPNRK